MTGVTPLDARAGRRCHGAVNPLHSLVYFSPELAEEFGSAGVTDRSSVYLAARAAPLGAVGPGTVTATFYSFSHRMIAERLPAVWRQIPPEQALESRLRAADRALRRLLGEQTVESPELAEAAELALRAAEGCERGARPLYAANADLPVPDEPHLALWHAATMLREHRGDGHLAVLLSMGLTGLEAQASHTATGRGMSPRWVLATRGFTEQEWRAALTGLRARGLVDDNNSITDTGLALRKQIEARTDDVDRAPYEHLGAAGVARLTELAGALTMKAVGAGAFPADLTGAD
ncbi:hypothetical protein GL263_21935 [Streptomyces durbertensis]|uniref:SalK n=1 Tax=Streptomyces durbertensis TaxID=2448886 RepID=A0ABR6EM57_9ACTN|nr:hypothetical protein [Streptomyces durbertensis]MBB1246193.1 hypothetical protein [Streptomyces durbertensis]